MEIKCIVLKPKNANILVKYLRQKNLLNKKIKIFKKGDYLCIPLKREINEEEINEIIKITRKKYTLDIKGIEKIEIKENNKINDDKTELEVKSFDVIGDIAITIIPKEYENKKYEIGKKIAKISNVKTVLAEKNAREGEFRLQEFECIYGEDKKETLYKENKCKFLVNVEKVYFSPRLSTDRLEIAKKIKEGENVLVMFSGVQPYPIVIAKHSKANLIISIEKNPSALFYSKENIKINKIKNVIFFIDDVKNVLPVPLSLWLNEEAKIEKYKNNNYFYFEKNKCFSPINLNKKIGIKTSIDEEEFLFKLERIKENLKYVEEVIIEIFLYFWSDLNKFNEFKEFVNKKIKKKVIFVIHQPLEIEIKKVNLQTINEDLRKLNFNSFDYLILHPSIFEDINQLIEFIKNHNNKEKILIENLKDRICSKDEIKKLIDNKINICFDLSHYMEYLMNNLKLSKEEAKKKIVEDFKELFFYSKEKNVLFYCHISNYPPEGNRIDKGKIPMDKIIPFIETGILEVKDENDKKNENMCYSFNLLFNPLKFDKIVMPLPKGSENFLDLAFENIKNHGFIHWYQFAREEEFEKLIEIVKEKAKKYNFNIKEINIKKVGQIKPRTWRVRVDFQVEK